MSLSDLPSGDKPLLPDEDTGADQDGWRPNANHFSQSASHTDPDSITDGPVTDSLVTEKPVVNKKPVVDVVSCDGADASLLVAALQLAGADAQGVTTFESWLARVPLIAPLPDVVALVGSAARIASQRWVEQARFVVPDVLVLTAVSHASIEQAAALVRQGTRGIVAIPADPQRIASGIDWLLREAAETQTLRRSKAVHRKNFTKLSEGEKRVLRALLAGHANKRIALDLKIGLRTVELRRSKIMKKMGANSIAQLICHICEADAVSMLTEGEVAISESTSENLCK